MYGGGHPDHGLSGVAGQHSAGTGMESAYGGAAIGVPGGLAAGQNEMGAFLDAMQERYGLESVTNFVNNYLNRHYDQQTLGQPLGIPAQGYRDLDYDSQTFGYNPVAPVEAEYSTPQAQMTRVPFGDLGLSYPAAGNMFDSSASPELEMSGRMTPDQLAALDAAQQNTQNFTNFEAYADPSVLADSMPAPNYGPQYGGGGDELIPPRWIEQDYGRGR